MGFIRAASGTILGKEGSMTIHLTPSPEPPYPAIQPCTVPADALKWDETAQTWRVLGSCIITGIEVWDGWNWRLLSVPEFLAQQNGE